MMDNRLTQLKEMLKAEPNDAFLLYAIAQEHISKGNLEAAEGYFETLQKENPDYVATSYHYGLCLYQLGKTDAAIQTWKKGKEIALKAGDRKTASEIQELLQDLGDEDDEY